MYLSKTQDDDQLASVCSEDEADGIKKGLSFGHTLYATRRMNTAANH